MSIVGGIELFGILACLAGLVVLARNWPLFRSREVKLLAVGLLVWELAMSTSNSLEWLGITAFLDVYEDYLQIMTPVFWGVFFYALFMSSEVEARERSEERLTLAVEGARIGLWDWRVKTGDLFVNEQWAGILGYSLAEIDPVNIDTWVRFCHPDDLAESKRLLKDHFHGRTEYYECELRMRHRDGHWVWIQVRGKVFVRDRSGGPVRMAGTNQEITELKTVKETVRNESARRMTIMDLSTDGIAVFGQDHRIVEANAAFGNMLGYTREEALKLHSWDFEAVMPEEEIREVFGDLSKINMTFETKHRRKDGSLVDVEVSAGGAMVGGEPMLFSITRDISARKALEKTLVRAKEQAEAANTAKTEFLANMSHEIRTPLNGIMGMLHLLNDTEDPEQQEYSLAAIQSTKRLTRLLTDILDLSRVEAGKLVVLDLPFDLPGTVRQVHELFEPAFRQAGVALEYHVDPAIPDVLLGDGVRLQQVLNNLVGNALKFTEQGSVCVEAHSLKPHSPEQFRVLFSVTDTGMGIADESLVDLFDAFTQADSTLGRQHQGGAGLGLAISKQLVELMGGSITVESEIGRGSSFQFCIPFGLAEPREEGAASADAKASSDGLRILVAEDSIINQMAITRLLKRRGHWVKAVRNGEDALAMLRRGKFDVVLMDIQMPGMDGLEATNAIRSGSAGEEMREVPIIALTGYALEGEREQFMEAGLDGYLAKPVEMDDLEEALARVAARIPKEK